MTLIAPITPAEARTGTQAHIIDAFAKAFYALSEDIPTEDILGALDEVKSLIEASEKKN
jgi:hypothetical protein